MLGSAKPPIMIRVISPVFTGTSQYSPDFFHVQFRILIVVIFLIGSFCLPSFYYFAQMPLLEKNLVIKKSIIPGAGKGLFTKVFIPKGTRIVEYKGRLTTWKEVDHNEGMNGYIYYIKRSFVIDAFPYKKALGRYVNDAQGLKRIKGLSNNSEYVIDGLKVFIEAKKDIPAGSEILVGYGKEYWAIVKYNRGLRKEHKERA
jgi:SET domain-containing protein